MFARGSSSLRLSPLPEQGRRQRGGEGRHAPLHPQSQGATDARGLLFLGQNHEGGIAFACDLCQSEADVSRHYRRTIKHYERKYATSEKEIGAPGSALRRTTVRAAASAYTRRDRPFRTAISGAFPNRPAPR